MGNTSSKSTLLQEIMQEFADRIIAFKDGYT